MSITLEDLRQGLRSDGEGLPVPIVAILYHRLDFDPETGKIDPPPKEDRHFRYLEELDCAYPYFNPVGYVSPQNKVYFTDYMESDRYVVEDWLQDDIEGENRYGHPSESPRTQMFAVLASIVWESSYSYYDGEEWDVYAEILHMIPIPCEPGEIPYRRKWLKALMGDVHKKVATTA